MNDLRNLADKWFDAVHTARDRYSGSRLTLSGFMLALLGATALSVGRDFINLSPKEALWVLVACCLVIVSLILQFLVSYAKVMVLNGAMHWEFSKAGIDPGDQNAKREIWWVSLMQRFGFNSKGYDIADPLASISLVLSLLIILGVFIIRLINTL